MTAAVAAPPQTNSMKFLTGGLIAGVIAAVINNVYAFAYTAITGNSIALVGPISITLASIVPLLIASVGYFIVARFLPEHAMLIFIVGTLVLTALTLVPFSGPLPDGSTAPAWFPVLTLPMHLIAGLVCAFGVPRLVNR